MSNQVLTPQMVESRLRELSHEIDEAHSELIEAESHYYSIKAQHEIALAETRISLSRQSAPSGRNYTVGEREDMAILANRETHLRLANAEALIRGVRANVARIRMQVDIARSVGTSVRTSMDLS